MIRGVAGFLAVLMFAQDLAWAYPDRSGSPVPSPPSASASGRSAGPLTIPSEMGRIEKSFVPVPSAAGEPVVVNIRDAHRKLGSQYAIRDLLELLTDRYQLGLISVEGASGPVHTGLLASMPDPEARDRMADGLLRKGRLSASEYFAITGGREVRLYGAEDTALYEKNRRFFDRTLELWPAADAWVRRMEWAMNGEARETLSPEALEFRTSRSRFWRRELTLNEHLTGLRALAARTGSGDLFKDQPHAARYLRLIRAESRIDLEAVDAERRRLIRSLRASSPALASDLARMTSDHASGRTGPAEFARQLVRSAKAQRIPAEEYRSVRFYARYWSEFGRLDLYGVWDDVKRIESALTRRLSSDPDAAGFFERDEERVLASKLVTLSLTSEEYRRVRRASLVPHLLRTLARSEDERDLVAAAAAFYRTAERRNRQLLSNTLRVMKRDGVRVGALVTGGFHSEGLADLMTAGRVSHLVILPKFDTEAGDRPYVTVLTRRPAEWEKRSSDDEFYLAAPSWAGSAPRTAAEAEPLLAELLAGRRADGEPDFTAAETDRYVRTYAALRRMDPVSNPLSPSELRRILGQVRSIRRTRPDVVEVTIGEKVWPVFVGQGTRAGASGARAAETPKTGSSRPVPSAPVPSVPAEERTVREERSAEADVPGSRTPAAAVSLQKNILRFAPEAMALFLTAQYESGEWGHALMAAVALRLINAAVFLIHGIGHWLHEVWSAAPSERRVRVTEGVPVRSILSSLLPFGAMPQTLAVPTFLGPGSEPGAPSLRDRWIAAGGILANAAALTLTSAVVWASGGQADWGPFQQMIWAGWTALSILAAASLPDWRTLFGWDGTIACGPFFIIRRREKSETQLLTPRMRTLSRMVSRYAASRGGQSAGFSIEAERRDVPRESVRRTAPVLLFDKLVKGKRQRIVDRIADEMASFARKMSRKGFKPRSGYEAVLAHLRYATGGATNWNNAQPHWHEDPAWVERFEVEPSRSGSAGPARVRRGPILAANMIGHNGDMDAADIELNFGGEIGTRMLSQGELRKFFVAAMPVSTSRGDSDSKSVAEWMDFHLTQGILQRSLRHAWFTTVEDAEAMIAGRARTPAPETWEAWAAEMAPGIEEALGQAGTIETGGASLKEASAQARKRFRDHLGSWMMGRVPEARMERFLLIAERAFFDQDLQWAMSRAAATFKGTFALMAYTSLEPRVGVFALTQAFSIGMNLTRGEVIGSAEPMGVTAALAGDPNDRTSQVMLRHGQFAILEMDLSGLQDIRSGVRIYDAHTSYDPGPWRPERLANNPWFPVNGNPKIDLPRPSPEDPDFDELGDNLLDLPAVLTAVRESFGTGGRNYAPLMYLRSLIRDKAKNWLSLKNGMKQAGPIDILIHGVDYNEHLARELAQQLNEAAPYLKIRVLNSGDAIKLYLRALERKAAGLEPRNIDDRTIVIGVSNSAQTQSAAEVTRLARAFAGSPEVTSRDPGRIFVMSQQLMNSMSATAGQGYQPEDPVLPITFQNLSHLTRHGHFRTRWNEAATVEPVATQAVLTEIFLGIVEDLSQFAEETGTDPFGLQEEITQDDVWAFRDFQKVSYEREAPERIGASAERYPARRGPREAALEAEARYRADNVTEWLDAFIAFAAYVMVSSMFGKFAAFAWTAGVLTAVGAGALSGLFALFFVWLTVVGVRIWKDRPRLDRIGTRNEVFIDKGWIAHMLDRYNKTLFSLAPAYVGVNTWAADNVSEALHRFGMVAHRGTVTIHRITDERLGEESAQSALDANMVRKQIEGIRFNKGQPQAHMKVREGSVFEKTRLLAPQAPPLTVLSDHMSEVRARHDGKMSRFALSWVEQRLLGLTDGLIAEQWIGYRQAVLVTTWAERKLVRIFGRWLGIRIARILRVDRIFRPGETANEAKVQSTAHPVGTQPSGMTTMEYRHTRRGSKAAETAPAPLFAADPEGPIAATVDLLMDGRLRMTPETGGAMVLLKPDPKGLRGSDDRGVEWSADWNADTGHQIRFTSTQGQVAVAPLNPLVRQWVARQMSDAGARLAMTVRAVSAAAGWLTRVFHQAAAWGAATGVTATVLIYFYADRFAEFADRDAPATAARFRALGSLADADRWIESLQAGASVALVAGLAAAVLITAFDIIIGFVRAVTGAVRGIRKFFRHPAPNPYPQYRARYILPRQPGPDGARLAENEARTPVRKIGVIVRGPDQQAVWNEEWTKWTGRAPRNGQFLFWIASPDGAAADADRLRRAGAWWVVDAADGVGSIPDWIRELDAQDAGVRGLLQELIAKMMSAPSSGLWTEEDWDRVTDLAQEALPASSFARIAANGPVLTAVPSAPASAVPADIKGILREVDRRLAESVLTAPAPAAQGSDVRFRSVLRALSLLSGASEDLPSGAASGTGAFRSPFALTDPSYRLTAAVQAPALMVTDLEIFAKDGGLPYRMRVEHLERSSKRAVHSYLLVRDPGIRTRAALLAAHPDAEVFGNRVLFAGQEDALEAVSREAQALGVSPDQAVWITSESASASASASSSSAASTPAGSWTMALSDGAPTTVGILEIAARILNDPDALQPGLARTSVRRFVYRWPKAVPLDYQRLVQAIRSAAVSA